MAMNMEIHDSRSWVPTVRGIMFWKPERSWAAVDKGAIPFLMNGADCMGAGIHIADPSIEPGGFVWIRDQESGAPLASGIALVDGEEMIKLKENSETVKFQLENERLSVIGVSVDEELTNLIQYQQGFQASARIISTVNTMLDVIVNLGR